MSNEAVLSMSNEVSEAQVADYLARHPEFFTDHMQLLTTLNVPHESGHAVSLVERQTSLLRERNRKMDKHLADIVESARYNDLQFDKTRRMVLALLECLTLDDLAVAVDESLCGDFHGDCTALLLFSQASMDINTMQLVDPRQLGPVTPLVETNLPCCGQLSEEQNAFIFADKAVRVQSAAVVPLVQGETLGLLAIGSYEAGYFHSAQGTVFLSYVGEVLSRVLSRILHQAA
ncbi:MAG: DUF484 family protein [Pontibacterium sp.]